MANRRMITGDMFEDEFIGALSFFDRLLWVGIITAVADDQGRLMDKPALIRSRVFLYDDDVKDSTVQASIDRLAVAHKIECYIAGGKALIQIVNWWKYQTPAWASPSKYPAPTGWVDRVKYHAAGNKIIMLNWDKTGGYVVDYVAPQDRALNDGDIKGDVNGEDEAPATPFELLQLTCERHGVLVMSPADEEGLEKLVKAGSIPADLIGGIEWKTARNNGRALYANQVVNATLTETSKRLQPNNNGNGTPKPRQRIVERNGVQILEDIPAGEQ